MHHVKTVLVLIVLAIVLGLAWIRLAPNAPEPWHTDPLTATRTTTGGWMVRPEGGDATGPALALPPAQVLQMLDTIALATPRTERLAGSMDDGRITYVTRSRLMGFPDFTTVTVVDTPDGAVPVLFARQRFGSDDMGVNRARVDDWLARLATAATP